MSSPCESCLRLFNNGSRQANPHVSPTPLNGSNEESSTTTSPCGICLGLWTVDFKDRLLGAVRTALEPYGGGGGGGGTNDSSIIIGNSSSNRFSWRISPPMIQLPGDIVYRFQHASSSSLTPTTQSSRPVLAQDFVQEVKQYAKSALVSCLVDELGFTRSGKSTQTDHDGDTNAIDAIYPPCVEEEELGYLACHVVVLPCESIHRPLDSIRKQKTGRKMGRRRHNMQDNSQGGDPRQNLERRLEREGKIIWTLNQALEDTKNDGNKSASLQQLPAGPNNSDNASMCGLDVYVAVWRRPFYIKGMYTKTRRDVSQTPFHVVDDGKRRKLGSTSVEEEITPAIVRICRGISTLNNDATLDNLVFGMAKFHASGREDMDVRMLLPEFPFNVDSTAATSTAGAEPKVTGRPFVYEIFDALTLPAMADLASMVTQVNHFTDVNSTPDHRSYGRNPAGVGISTDLSFVPSASFKKLQEETEDKVKHYGCLCWSEKPIPTTDRALMELLGSFPVELQQRTPIRVLHRRSNAVRIRHVLTCRAHCIDDHHFRLNISTSAGTYVKEFVHGDLGRTVPSVSSLLGCTTDILQLDCEGIQY